MSHIRQIKINTSQRLEECLALKQRADYNIYQKVKCQNHTFLPEGIQIEDLTQASYHA